MLRTLCIVSLIGACATPRQPLGGASSVTVGPVMTVEHRQTQMVLRRLSLRAWAAHGGLRARRDASLVQNGIQYDLAGYLPVLQAEGIATDLQNPGEFLRQSRRSAANWFLGGVATVAFGAGMLASGRQSFATPGVTLVFGGVMFGVFGSGASLRAGKKLAQPTLLRARDERAQWVRTFNERLAKQLALGDLGLPQDTDLVPAPKVETSSTTSR